MASKKWYLIIFYSIQFNSVQDYGLINCPWLYHEMASKKWYSLQFNSSQFNSVKSAYEKLSELLVLANVNSVCESTISEHLEFCFPISFSSPLSVLIVLILGNCSDVLQDCTDAQDDPNTWRLLWWSSRQPTSRYLGCSRLSCTQQFMPYICIYWI